MSKQQRVWECPEQPDGVTKVRDYKGDVWELLPNDFWQCKNFLPKKWKRLITGYGPLIEVLEGGKNDE